MQTVSNQPRSFPPDDNLIARLQAILQEWELLDFVEVCEDALRSGRGYATVHVKFSNFAASDINCEHGRKPRKPPAEA